MASPSKLSSVSSKSKSDDVSVLLRELMSKFPKADPNSLRPAAIPGFVSSMDAVMANLRATHARLEARVAMNAAREATLVARERALAAEEAVLRAAAASSSARASAADALLARAAASYGGLSRMALDASASAAYNFEERFGNLVRANQARERGFSASVALDVTNTLPRAGVSEWSARVAAGGGMKTTRSVASAGPPASPLRRPQTAAQTRLRNPFGF
jgi:hypothetical protein